MVPLDQIERAGPKETRQVTLGSSVFSTVGAEMLTGDSVGEGWDQIERTGPKESRQVTLR